MEETVKKKRRVTKEQALAEAKPVIDELYKRPLSPSDMIEILGLPKGDKGFARIIQIITTVSKYYPVYQPGKFIYKILTKEDLARYEESHRNHIVENMETYEWR